MSNRVHNPTPSTNQGCDSAKASPAKSDLSSLAIGDHVEGTFLETPETVFSSPASPAAQCGLTPQMAGLSLEVFTPEIKKTQGKDQAVTAATPKAQKTQEKGEAATAVTPEVKKTQGNDKAVTPEVKKRSFLEAFTTPETKKPPRTPPRPEKKLRVSCGLEPSDDPPSPQRQEKARAVRRLCFASSEPEGQKARSEIEVVAVQSDSQSDF